MQLKVTLVAFRLPLGRIRTCLRGSFWSLPGIQSFENCAFFAPHSQPATMRMISTAHLMAGFAGAMQYETVRPSFAELCLIAFITTRWSNCALAKTSVRSAFSTTSRFRACRFLLTQDIISLTPYTFPSDTSLDTARNRIRY
jgi:hypothetical protein